MPDRLPALLCPACSVVDTPRLGDGSGPHVAKATCAHCGRFIKWLPKALVQSLHRGEGMLLSAGSGAVAQMAFPLSCQALSWQGALTVSTACGSGLVYFSAFDDRLSTLSWTLCQEHSAALRTCTGCGRGEALGPYNIIGTCMDCTSAAQWGNEARWYVSYRGRGGYGQ